MHQAVDEDFGCHRLDVALKRKPGARGSNALRVLVGVRSEGLAWTSMREAVHPEWVAACERAIGLAMHGHRLQCWQQA